MQLVLYIGTFVGELRSVLQCPDVVCLSCVAVATHKDGGLTRLLPNQAIPA